MDALLAFVRRVQDGLARHAFQSETAVRSQIVLPILERLGWDIYDTAVVNHEYPLKVRDGTRRVDLGLLVPGRGLHWIVELKAVGQSQGDEQLFEYAYHAGAPLALLSNGERWRIYITYRPGSYEERLVRTLDFANQSPDDIVAALHRYLSFDHTASGKAADYARADLEKNANRNRARKKIPEAWRRLVAGGEDERLVDLLVEATSRLSDYAPTKEDVADFLHHLHPSTDEREVRSGRRHAGEQAPVKPPPLNRTEPLEPPRPAPPPRQVRYHLLGTEHSADNAAQAFVQIFRALADRDAGLLERLDPQVRGRKNRLLARSVADLTATAAMRRAAVSLPGGWWLLTHLSNKQKMSNLKVACTAADIPFGRPDGLQIDLPNS